MGMPFLHANSETFEPFSTCSGRSIQPIKATATEMPPTVLSKKLLFCISVF